MEFYWTFKMILSVIWLERKEEKKKNPDKMYIILSLSFFFPLEQLMIVSYHNQHDDTYSLAFNIHDISRDQNAANVDESDTVHIKVIPQLCVDSTLYYHLSILFEMGELASLEIIEEVGRLHNAYCSDSAVQTVVL